MEHVFRVMVDRKRMERDLCRECFAIFATFNSPELMLMKNPMTNVSLSGKGASLLKLRGCWQQTELYSNDF